MRAIWSRLERWAAEHIDGTLDLRPGCREGDLDALEAELGCHLPVDFRSFYLIHDGQESGADFGLIYGLPVLPIDQVTANWRMWSEIADSWTDHEHERCLSGERIQPLYANRGWVPFTHDWGGNHLGVDLAPGPTGLVGQVINFGRDEQDKYVLADNFTAMWGWLLEQYEAGNIEAERNSAGVMSARPLEPPATHALDAFPRMLGLK
jgi:cell wall assembly regulator SMI1